MHTTTTTTSLARSAWADFLSGGVMIEFTPVEPEAVEITAAKNEASYAIKKVLHARHVEYVEAMEAHLAKLEASYALKKALHARHVAHTEAMEAHLAKLGAIRAQEVFPCDLSELDTDELSMQELEAAMLEAPYGEEFEFFAAAWQERLELAAMDERA